MLFLWGPTAPVVNSSALAKTPLCPLIDPSPCAISISSLKVSWCTEDLFLTLPISSRHCSCLEDLYPKEDLEIWLQLVPSLELFVEWLVYWSRVSGSPPVSFADKSSPKLYSVLSVCSLMVLISKNNRLPLILGPKLLSNSTSMLVAGSKDCCGCCLIYGRQSVLKILRCRCSCRQQVFSSHLRCHLLRRASFW